MGDDDYLIKAKQLCDFLVKENLVDTDRIVISENILLKKLTDMGWQRDIAQKTIDYLISVEIRMMDDGEEMDYFFIHF